MSAVLDIFDRSSVVLGVHHNDPMTLQPGAIKVEGYADLYPVNPEYARRGAQIPVHLQIAENVPVHVLHIRRDQLDGVTLVQINEIEIDGQDKTYRVRHFFDDPATGPDVEFYCTLA